MPMPTRSRISTARRSGLRAACLVVMGLLASPGPADAWEMNGVRQVALHTRDGGEIAIGTVTFRPADGKTSFTLALDTAKLKDFFLSMREFKCVEGPEIQCYVPYPYANPKTVTADDLTWLEHSLIFFYKAPTDFGAVLQNGLYYKLKSTDEGLVGTPQAIDLNAIASPPQDPGVPPFGPDERTEIEPKARWIDAITIR